MTENREVFRNAVEVIFNGWTALKLTVEHGMVGANGRDAALKFVEQVTDFCNSAAAVEDLVDYLEDYMDAEFQTLCEDNSPEEVATVLWQFYQLYKSGNHELLNIELNKLPKCEIWLFKPLAVHHYVNHTPAAAAAVPNSSDNSQDITMKESSDPEWTQVKTRRRKERTET